jgi:hypothetical protein
MRLERAHPGSKLCAFAACPKETAGGLPKIYKIARRRDVTSRSRCLIERMIAHEVLCRQHPAKPPFKATDAQTTVHRLHARRFPNLWLDSVDLRQFIEGLTDALIVSIKGESLLHLLPI